MHCMPMILLFVSPVSCALFLYFFLLTFTSMFRAINVPFLSNLTFLLMFSPLFLLFYFVAIILRTVFFFISLFGSFGQLYLAHSSFSCLLRLNISLESCTMLVSSLFCFQVNIYLTVCSNLYLFPTVEPSPLFFSLTL